MADVNKTIEISYTANIGALERALKRIPGITEEQMKKAINEVEKELKQAERAAEKTSKSFKEKFSNMGKSAAMAGTAIVGAGYAMLEFGQRVADATNDLVDTSTKTGIAAETLQGLKIAAEGSGLAFEQFIGPLQKLQFFMVEANNENKNAIDLFDRMGVQINDTNGDLKNADDVFREMMKSLGEMDSDLERNTLLMKMFGEQGAIFAQSGVVGAMDEFISLGREFGVDVGPAAVQSAADFQRAMADLQNVGTGAMQDILMTITGTNGLSPAIDALAEGIIYIKAAFVAAFNAISAPISVVNSKLLALNYLLEFDFEKAGAALAEGTLQASKNIDTALGAFDEAEKEIKKLGEAREKIRQTNQRASKESEMAAEKRKKEANEREKQNNKEIEQLEKIIELRSDDLDVMGDIFDAQGSLLQMGKELYKGELSAEEKLQQAHQERLERIKEIEYTEQKAYAQRQKDLTKAFNDGLMSEEEYTRRRINLRDELVRMYEKGNFATLASEQRLSEEIIALDTQTMQRRLEEIRNYFNEARRITSDIFSAFIQLQDANTDALIDNKQQAIDNINELEQNGVISAEKAAAKRKEVDELYQKDIEKQAMKAFKLKKAAAISSITIDMAMSAARAMKDWPYPASLGIAALAATKAGLELAVVQSQPPPKFDVGGMVGQSDPLAPDQTQAQLLTGEAVLDRATVERLGGVDGIRNLQSGSKNQVVVVQPFKHFDRFIQSGQKRGNFGAKNAMGGY